MTEMRIFINSGMPLRHVDTSFVAFIWRSSHVRARLRCVCVVASTKIEQIDGVFSKTRIMSLPLLLEHWFTLLYTLHSSLMPFLLTISLLTDMCACVSFFVNLFNFLFNINPPIFHCNVINFARPTPWSLNSFARKRFPELYLYKREKHCRTPGTL